VTIRTRVKICGITRPDDAIAAAQAGADAIGLVFYPDSPRYVDIETARAVVAAVPPFVSVVGLVVDLDEAAIRQILAAVHLDMLQFHGEESPAFCARLGMPYIKALRMRDDRDVGASMSQYTDARAVLLDAYQAGVPGGTGSRFDWSRVPVQRSKPVILAGGLTVDNVAAAIAQVHPYAVDVSGGVEKTKGVKDHDKIAAFIKEVNNVGTS
jgi:phosphoribosylanthranilate isomerase